MLSPTLILDLPVAPGPNHNGGTMTFGPDSKLYIVIGELNRNGQLQNVSGGADYDGNGKVDVTVDRSGAWYIKRSSDGWTTLIGWGGLGQDIVVPGDY